MSNITLHICDSLKLVIGGVTVPPDMALLILLLCLKKMKKCGHT